MERSRIEVDFDQWHEMQTENVKLRAEVERLKEQADAKHDLREALAKSDLQVDELRTVVRAFMHASDLAKDITFAPVYKYAEKLLAGVTEKQNGESCNATLDGGEVGPYRCAFKKPCPDHGVQKQKCACMCHVGGDGAATACGCCAVR